LIADEALWPGGAAVDCDRPWFLYRRVEEAVAGRNFAKVDIVVVLAARHGDALDHGWGNLWDLLRAIPKYCAKPVLDGHESAFRGHDDALTEGVIRNTRDRENPSVPCDVGI
jgi:hypothetical protein